MGGVASSQYLDCNTVVSAPDSLVVLGKTPAYNASISFAEINFFIHVLRESGGSGGLSQARIDSMMLKASDDLGSLSVYFSIAGQEDLDNSTYYNDPDGNAGSLFSENPHTDAIDIYLGPVVGGAKGRASGIPGSALVLTGNLDSFSALSHLLGNCLGLYSTDETIFGVENPDGSNGGSTGDLVSDTAADPGLMDWVDSNCSLASGFYSTFPNYDPDPQNIMSNGRMSCWTIFSEDQRARVLTAVESYSVLKNVQFGPSSYVDYSDSTNLWSFYDPNEIESVFPHKRTNAVACDFIGDGKKDVLISGYPSANPATNRGFAGRCNNFTAEGIPRFYDATDDVFSTRPPNGTIGLLLADYDNDGDLDFYAPNAKFSVGSSNGSPHRMFNFDGGVFSDVTSTVFPATESPSYADLPTYSGAWGDYDGDGFVDLLVAESGSLSSPGYNGGAVKIILFHNQLKAGSDPTAREFIDVTAAAGLDTDNHGVRSILWLDLDQDHDLDIVTIQYSRDLNAVLSKYFVNNGNGTFSDNTSSKFPGGVGLKKGRSYAAPGDFDNDGDIDIVFHGSLNRGVLENDFHAGAGGSLSMGWIEEYEGGEQWHIYPSDLDAFDSDLDGYLDFGISGDAYVVGAQTHWLFRNTFQNSQSMGFTKSTIGNHNAESITAADWNLDGFPELMIATHENGEFFFRNGDAVDGSNTNHWAGVRLRAENGSCNTFGIGATVILTASTLTQAQVVDGGSGHAGQHDLDLSFGLGSCSDDSVKVRVIWPCGQTMIESIPVDQYSTLTLDMPEILSKPVVPIPVKAYLNWIPGESVVTWVYEWYTAHPSDMSFDQVEFPNGEDDGGNTVYFIDESRADVDYTVTRADSSQPYVHIFKWHGRPCQIQTVYFKIHSKALNFEDVTKQYTFNIPNCPQSN